MLLFVYGSLKKGCSNNNLLKSAKYLGECSTVDKYNLISLGNYPALTNKKNYIIHGELYKISDSDKETMDNLDNLEDYPELYNKKYIEVNTGQFALVYYMEQNVADRLKYVELDIGKWEEKQENAVNKEKNRI